MSRDDYMLPPHPCSICGATLGGRVLSDDSYFQPAELYLGTYTGLCYRCMNGGPYVVREDVTKSEHITYYSHPPTNPAWRRDRVEYLQYAGCDCNKGTEYKTGYDGRYRAQCSKCMTRHSNHYLYRFTHENNNFLVYWHERYEKELIKRGYATKKKGEITAKEEYLEQIEELKQVYRDRIMRDGKFLQDWYYRNRWE